MITDFHSHVLPAIDDGSRSWEESVDMLRVEAQHGIEHVVATPHFYPHRDDPERFLNRRKNAEILLREKLKTEGGLPRLSIGAEVYFFAGISDSEALSMLTIDNGNYIMIEMPEAPWKDNIYRELESIYTKQGLVPIIAHVDRYVAPLRTYGIFERLTDMPVLVQANASFFLNRATASMALKRLQKGQIHLLGSDCHNMVSRPPRLGEAVEVIRSRLGDEALIQIEGYEQQVFGGTQ